MIHKIEQLFLKEISTIATQKSSFGFKERAMIERCLFLLLKFVCNKKCGCEIQGFSNEHIKEIKNKITHNNKPLIAIIEQLYEYKVFIKSLSSNSAYTIGDTLSRANINKSEIHNFLEQKTISVISKIKHESVEQCVQRRPASTCDFSS